MNKYLLKLLIILTAAVSMCIIGCPTSESDSDDEPTKTTVKPADSSSQMPDSSSSDSQGSDSSAGSESSDSSFESSSTDDSSSGPDVVSAATLDVTIDIIDNTADNWPDNIFRIKFYWGEGIYDQTGNNDLPYQVTIAKSAMNIQKISNTDGIVTFTIENDDLISDFDCLFYYLEIYNSSNLLIANLKEIYQDNVQFTSSTRHAIELEVDGKYGTMDFNL